MNKAKLAASAATLAAAATMSGAGFAQHAENGGIALVPAKSAVAEEVHAFHNLILMPVMTGISLFVLALLIWVVAKYNKKANPNPRKFSHNTLVEVLWTGIPVIILLFIALFSFDLLYKEDQIPDGKQVVEATGAGKDTFAFANDFSPRRRVTRADHIEVLLENGEGARKLSRGADYSLEGLGEDVINVKFAQAPAAGGNVVIRGGRTRVGPQKILGFIGEDRSEIATAPTVTVKVNGFQWGWSYSYPDFGDFELTSLMLKEEQTTPELYRLAVDNPIYVPVGETIRIVTTARDVIHSWAMPNFAIKIDAVPGRINETWFSANEVGTYYGQCSEICGVKHSFMPIEVRVVTRPEFMAWVAEQRDLNGMEPLPIAGDASQDRTALLDAAASQQTTND
ncbi:MAG: cytochrome c oxidase subunit II transmembrane domain-containing protein [Pseudomonadota bacterium]